MPHGQGDRDDLIKAYFHRGFNYKEIVDFLLLVHGSTLSVRQLKRILNTQGLYRRKFLDRLEDVALVIEDELRQSGSLLGYRSMHHRLTCTYGIRTSRETVRRVLAILDPNGVQLRTSHRLRRRLYWARGPNYIWHIDGNDKLVPYGLAIHGAIDGYSRKLLWLEVGPSNKNPSITAGYFLDYVRQVGGTALHLRFDPGTENGLTAQLHSVLTYGAGRSTFGASAANQRIECWWSFLKRSFLGWWINYFKDMVSVGLLNTADLLHIEGVRYFFGRVLKEALYQVVTEWNSHRMRTVSESESPGGRPDVLYFTPERAGTHDVKQVCTDDDIDGLEDQVERWSNFLCSDDMVDLVQAVMGQDCSPQSVDEAREMFEDFLERLHNM